MLLDDLDDARGPRVLAVARHRYADETGSVRIAGDRIAWIPGFSDGGLLWVYDSRGRRLARADPEREYWDVFDIQTDGTVALCGLSSSLTVFKPPAWRLLRVRPERSCGDVRIAADRVVWTREADDGPDLGSFNITDVRGLRTRQILPSQTDFDWNGIGVAWGTRSGIRYLRHPQ